MRYRYFVTFVSYDGQKRWVVGNEVLARDTEILREADIAGLLRDLDRRYEGRHHTLLWFHLLGHSLDG